MKRIVLISCASKKEKAKSKAKDLYISAIFKSSLAYGISLKPDLIFILSAKHHLLDLEETILPYDVTLSYISPKQKAKKPNLKVLTKEEASEWGKVVILKLSEIADLKNDEFIIIAGQPYVIPLADSLHKISEPLKGVIQGKRLNKLKELNNTINEK